MSRPVLWSLFALLVVIWSSTWVAIKFGLEDTPPLLGAGLRFTAAGALLLVVAVATRRRLRTDVPLAAIMALLPFAVSYGLVYWGEQYIPSGLAAVLFGVMPLFVALMVAGLVAEEAVTQRLVAGLLVAFGGLALGFSESLELGSDDRAAAGAVALVLAALSAAAGNVAIRLRAGGWDPIVLNGWGMLGGGLLLLAGSAVGEAWGDAAWTGQAVAAIAYLAVIGSAIPFVILTILLGRLGALTMSTLPLLLPFGALVLGAALYDESLTAPAAAGAALVAAGLLLARRRTTPVPA